MKHKDCRKALKAMIPYISGELDAAGSQAVAAHLAECELCSIKFAEMRRLMTLLDNDTVALPDKQSWQRLADEAFMKWRGESRRNSTGPMTARGLRWERALQSLFTPIVKPVLAGVFMLAVGAMIFLAGGNADTYDRSDFYARHFAESARTWGLEDSVEARDDFVMGFSYSAQSGSFTLGTQYAHTYQACAFAFEHECKENVQALNRVLAGYPHADLDAGGYSANKAAQLAALRTLHDDIKRDIAPLEAEYFLYQLGGWAQDMGFAVAAGVDTITEERTRAAEFARLARQFNLARGVVEALAEIETILSHRPVSAQDHKALQTRLGDIYTILG